MPKAISAAAQPARSANAEPLIAVRKSFVQIWRWMGEGKFPTARTVGAQQIARLESEIDDWMLSRPLRQYKSREVA